ncbi:sigma factor [Micromonosporaceae bacterium Da 78-11]
MATAEDRFTRLYEQHYDAVERYVRRRADDAAVRDVVAEVFVVAWRRLAELPGEPLPWLYGTARRVLANEVRGAQRRTRLAARVADHVDPASRDHADEVAGRLSVAAAFRRLPEADAEASRLVAWESLGLRDAARAAGCSLPAFAIVPTRTETWRRADDSGRLRASYQEPQFPAGTDRWWWRLHGSPGGGDHPRSEDYPPGGFPAMWAGRPPTTGFADWLQIGHPVENGPAEVLVAVTDLVRERVLTPADRAAVLRTVADLPGLSSDGTVVDRAGRPGQAFSLVSDYSGLPTRYTLIVDPVTGAPLGFESMLTTRAGKLDVRVPAVIGYETYATAEFAGDPG